MPLNGELFGDRVGIDQCPASSPVSANRLQKTGFALRVDGQLKVGDYDG